MRTRTLWLSLVFLVVRAPPLPSAATITIHHSLEGTTTTTSVPHTIHTWDKGQRVWRWIAKEYPSPQHIQRFCNRFDPGYICDPDGVFNSTQLDQLDESLIAIKNGTSCACKKCPPKLSGMSVGVAIMKHVFIPYNKSTSTVLKHFANILHETWDISSCKDALIIILVTEDNSLYTSIGPGLVDRVTRESVDRIILENRPYFQEGKYYDGMQSLIKNYHSLLFGIMHENAGELTAGTASSTGLIVGLIVGLTVVALLVGIVVVVHRSRTRRYRPKDPIATSSNSWNRKDAAVSDRPFFLGTPSNGVYHPCSTADETLQTSGADSDVPQDSYEPIATEDEEEQERSVAKEKDAPAKVNGNNALNGTPAKFIDDEEIHKETGEGRSNVDDVPTTPTESRTYVNGAQVKETDIV